MLVIIAFIYGIVLNFFGKKIVWISAGIGFLLAIVTMGGAAVVSVVLIMPVILRLIFEQISPFLR